MRNFKVGKDGRDSIPRPDAPLSEGQSGRTTQNGTFTIDVFGLFQYVDLSPHMVESSEGSMTNRGN